LQVNGTVARVKNIARAGVTVAFPDGTEKLVPHEKAGKWRLAAIRRYKTLCSRQTKYDCSWQATECLDCRIKVICACYNSEKDKWSKVMLVITEMFQLGKFYETAKAIYER